MNVSGTWSGTLDYKTSSLLVPAGSTSMTFTLSQSAGANVVTFTSPPTQGNGVEWACPQGTMNGETLSLSGPCALTNTLRCQAQATPSVRVNPATATGPATLSWMTYSYVWTGTSCAANNVSVTVAEFELTKVDATPK